MPLPKFPPTSLAGFLHVTAGQHNVYAWTTGGRQVGHSLHSGPRCPRTVTAIAPGARLLGCLRVDPALGPALGCCPHPQCLFCFHRTPDPEGGEGRCVISSLENTAGIPRLSEGTSRSTGRSSVPLCTWAQVPFLSG